jgi:citrate synthase
VLAFAAAAGGGVVGEGSDDPAVAFLQGHGVAATPPRRRLVNAGFILCADHELNASTFAARVAASTGADLHACLLAALAAFSGPRHGGASRAVEDLLEEMGSPARAESVVRARTARGDGMPGFGHPLYPQGDPRATTLLALARAAGAAARLRPLDTLIAATTRRRGEHPNVDAGLVALSLAAGLPRGAGVAVFAVGRLAGWIAHVLEQRQSPAILRPRAHYIGAGGGPPPQGDGHMTAAR